MTNIARADKVALAWLNNSGVGNALAIDLAMSLMLNKEKDEPVFNTPSVNRSIGSVDK